METIRLLPRKDVSFNHMKEKLEKADIAAIGHYTEFGFMSPRIHSMNSSAEKIFGPAVTVRIPSQDSKALHIAVSMAQEGDVIVIDRSQDTTHACVGEMIALCANVRKVAAIIVDGPMTDYEEIMDIGIPVYATGVSPLTTKFISSCGEINDDISCGGVVVHPGDLIMADKNGVLVLRCFEAEKLIDEALADQKSEQNEKKEILAGKTLQELYAPEYPV